MKKWLRQTLELVHLRPEGRRQSAFNRRNKVCPANAADSHSLLLRPFVIGVIVLMQIQRQITLGTHQCLGRHETNAVFMRAPRLQAEVLLQTHNYKKPKCRRRRCRVPVRSEAGGGAAGAASAQVSSRGKSVNSRIGGNEWPRH